MSETLSYQITPQQYVRIARALRACTGPGGHERHGLAKTLDAWANKAKEAEEAGRTLPALLVTRGHLRGLKLGMLAAFQEVEHGTLMAFYETAAVFKFPGDFAKCAPRLPEEDDLVLDGDDAVLEGDAAPGGPADPLAGGEGG